jgi:uncharacterized protein (DUF983 family)
MTRGEYVRPVPRVTPEGRVVTYRWAGHCPICGAQGERDMARGRLALDCTCTECGWHYTSAWARAILRACTRPERWAS